MPDLETLPERRSYDLRERPKAGEGSPNWAIDRLVEAVKAVIVGADEHSTADSAELDKVQVALDELRRILDAGGWDEIPAGVSVGEFRLRTQGMAEGMRHITGKVNQLRGGR